MSEQLKKENLAIVFEWHLKGNQKIVDGRFIENYRLFVKDIDLHYTKITETILIPKSKVEFPTNALEEFVALVKRNKLVFTNLIEIDNLFLVNMNYGGNIVPLIEQYLHE